jgi:hypothetical protein
MAEIQVPDYASVKLWWEKTNELGTAIGDLDNFNILVDPLFGGATNPNIVSAINSLFVSFSDNDRLVLVRAIAMS